MKINTAILALFLSLLIIQTNTQDQQEKPEKTCADNPLLPHLTEFIEKQNQFIDFEEHMEYGLQELSDELDLPSENSEENSEFGKGDPEEDPKNEEDSDQNGSQNNDDDDDDDDDDDENIEYGPKRVLQSSKGKGSFPPKKGQEENIPPKKSENKENQDKDFNPLPPPPKKDDNDDNNDNYKDYNPSPPPKKGEDTNSENEKPYPPKNPQGGKTPPKKPSNDKNNDGIDDNSQNDNDNDGDGDGTKTPPKKPHNPKDKGTDQGKGEKPKPPKGDNDTQKPKPPKKDNNTQKPKPPKGDNDKGKPPKGDNNNNVQNMPPKKPQQSSKEEQAKLKQKKQKQLINQTIQKKILKQKFHIDSLLQTKLTSPSKLPSSLPMCSSLENQDSCCSAQLIEDLQKVTRGFYLKNQKLKPIIYKQKLLLKQYSKKNTHRKCPTKDLFKKITQDLINKNAYEDQRQCQKKAIFTVGNLIRGTMCQVCMDPSKFDDFFHISSNNNNDNNNNDIKMKVNPSDIQKYKEAMKEYLECTQNAQQQFIDQSLKHIKIFIQNHNCEMKEIKQIKTIINDPDSIIQKILDHDYSDNDTGMDPQVPVSLPPGDSTDQETNPCDQNPKFFDVGCLGQMTINGIELDMTNFFNNNNRRILQTLGQSGSYLQDENGVSGAYEENPEEEQEMQSLPDSIIPPQIQDSLVDDGLDQELKPQNYPAKISIDMSVTQFSMLTQLGKISLILLLALLL